MAVQNFGSALLGGFEGAMALGQQRRDNAFRQQQIQLQKDAFNQEQRAYEEGAAQREATLAGTRVSTAATDLQNAANRKAQEDTAGFDLISEIDGSGDYRLDGYGKYDFERLAKERPDLAARVFGMQEQFQTALNADGQPYKVSFAGVIDNGNGTASLAVRNPDGSLAPVTKNRTNDPNDEVFTLPWEEFNKLGSNYLTAMASAGGRGTWARDTKEFYDAVFRNEAMKLAAASPDIAGNPAALSEITFVINSPSSDRATSEQVIRDFGGDPEATLADAERRWKEQDAAKDEALSTYEDQYYTNGKPTVPSKGLVNMSYEERVQYFKDNPIRRTGVNGVNLYDTFNFFENQQRKMVQDIVNKRASGAPLTQKELINLDKYGTKFPDIEPQAAEERKTAESQVQDESGVQLFVELDTPENVAAAITGDDTQPTEEQKSQMATYLQNAGVQSAGDLGRLPPEDIIKAAYIAAAQYPLDQRMGVMQSLINTAQTGNPATDANTAINTRLRAKELAFNKEKYINGLFEQAKIDQRTITEKFNTAIGTAFDDLTELQNLMIDEETGAFIAPPNTATTKLNNIWNKASSYVEGSPEASAYSKVAMEALFTHMLASANAKKPGFTEYSNKIDKWFNDEGQLRVGVGAISGLVRETRQDGFLFVDPNGGKYNFEISKAAFRDQYGDAVMRQIEKQARANATRARAQTTREQNRNAG